MNEQLSKSYILKYNDLSGEYVICENPKQKRNISLFSRRVNLFQETGNLQQPTPAPQQPQATEPSIPSTPPTSAEPPRPMQPSDSPSNTPAIPPLSPAQRPTEAITLSRNLYNLLRVLRAEYTALTSLNASTSDYFNNLATQTAIFESTALNIYRSLSGTSSTPLQTYQTPTFLSYCDGIRQTLQTMQTILQTIARLQQIISVQNINRELTVMYSTINANLVIMNSTREECDANGL